MLCSPVRRCNAPDVALFFLLFRKKSERWLILICELSALALVCLSSCCGIFQWWLHSVYVPFLFSYHDSTLAAPISKRPMFVHVHVRLWSFGSFFFVELYPSVSIPEAPFL
jgi:hypothetical protein